MTSPLTNPPSDVHPFNVGDIIDNGRFSLTRKLANGSPSTVWLATRAGFSPIGMSVRHWYRELPNGTSPYVAVKIMDANLSKTITEFAILGHLFPSPHYRYITRPFFRFELRSPKGTHQCLAFELMSTTAASLVEDLHMKEPTGEKLIMERLTMKEPTTEELPDSQPKMPKRYPVRMAKRILLHTLRGLALFHKNGVVHGNIQPNHLLIAIQRGQDFVFPQLEKDKAAAGRPLHRIDSKGLWYMYSGQLSTKLGGLGTAFQATHPPADTAAPISLRAPELFFHLPLSTSIDIWSLGCLVYEFLTGEALFAVMEDGEVRGAQEDADIDLFCQLQDTLGKVPDYVRKAVWRNGQWSSAERNHLPPAHRGYFREDVPYLYESLEARFSRAKHPDLGDAEAIAICLLIRKMLAYDPAERPTAEELLKHPWFAFGTE